MGKKKFKMKKPQRKKKIPAALPSSPAPPWTELPTDVAANILQRLSCVELLESVQKVCTTWRSLCRDPAMWRVIKFSDVDVDVDSCDELEIICRHAVDRSQGQLLDINLEYFGTDELLHYISERSNQLRCLSLACCDDISGIGLREAAKKLPQLEELHLFCTRFISAEGIEAIGLSCPMLKSFTFTYHRYIFPLLKGNEFPMAIAKSMPALRHLCLIGNKMTNEGVEAILDGCPQLESLDLRKCFSVDLKGDLGSRCFQRLKGLKGPGDSTSDYKWEAEIYDCEYDEDYSPSEFGDYSVGDYDDFTDPFNDLYLNDEYNDYEHEYGFFFWDD
ncbi:F-box protein SKIP19-like isoform X1 [Henckelia pumila]|uniref:F-box protein SKIP19-like isoform X1 n=1 Tax=Henckelia pumila TaxID=405737 RepID=UPI003C6DE632